jgi:hypothetical protein
MMIKRTGTPPPPGASSAQCSSPPIQVASYFSVFEKNSVTIYDVATYASFRGVAHVKIASRRYPGGEIFKTNRWQLSDSLPFTLKLTGLYESSNDRSPRCNSGGSQVSVMVPDSGDLRPGILQSVRVSASSAAERCNGDDMFASREEICYVRQLA